MDTYTSLAVLGCIYAGSSIFSGLSGFGFAAIGSLSLLILPPAIGVPLLMALSLTTQTASLVSLRKELLKQSQVMKSHLLPLFVGGAIGVPCGLQLLTYLDATQLLIGLGILLISYAAHSIWNSRQIALKGQKNTFWQAVGVGATGGLIGGFSAFPGAALVVWNGLRGAGKEEGRALTQPYILFMQIIGLAFLYINRPSTFTSDFWLILLIATPLVLLGNCFGVSIYRRTGDLGYRKVTLIALGLSGLGLIGKTVFI
jgi:uncharacterized protein